MSYTYGFAGIATCKSANLVGANTSSIIGGQKVAIRIFSAALAASSNTLDLYNGTVAADAIATNKVLYLDKSNPYINSNAGWLFTSGCYAVATGGTANVVFIQEIY